MPSFGEFTPGTINVKVRTPDGGTATFDVSDFGPYPLWSTINVASTQTADLTYFQFGVGATRPGVSSTATLWDTNLTNSNGTLGAVDEMLIWSLRIAFAPAINLADAQDLATKVYVSMHISTEKPVTEGPTDFFPAGGGVYGVTTQSAAEQWSNGVPAASAARVFAQPHYLPGIVTFYGKLRPKAALAMGAAREVRYTLDGLRRRPSS